MWQVFLKCNEMSCWDVCKLLRIMFSVPANTEWIECAYSILELTCQQRQNRMAMKNLFFLGVLQVKAKDAFSYNQEAAYLLKES